MLVFRGKCFCTFYEDCSHQSSCDRPLTPERNEEAKTWWKEFNLPDYAPPIDCYAEKPSCHSSISP